MRLRIPSWLALIVAIPLLMFAAVGGFIHTEDAIVLQILFGVPGLLFFLLWIMSRRRSKRFGFVRINRNTRMAFFSESDGTETSVQFQRFLSIRIQKVIKLQGYSWMAVLCGETGNLILELEFSFKNSLIERVAPVGDWLKIPIEVSSESVNFLDWLSTPNFRTNPYPTKIAFPTPHSSGTPNVRP